MLTEIRMSLERQHGHNADVFDNDRNFFYALLIESLLFLVIMAFMRRHIKKTLDGRLIR